MQSFIRQIDRHTDSQKDLQKDKMDRETKIFSIDIQFDKEIYRYTLHEEKQINDKYINRQIVTLPQLNGQKKEY